MPLKNSKKPKLPPSQKKAERVCDRDQLIAFAKKLATELQPGDRLWLEGELGVGKSTFAQAVLEQLKVSPAPQGSPTFPLVHEYQASSRFERVLHVDLYRLKSETEVEQAGLLEPLSGLPGTLLICEWLSQFEDLERALTRARGSRWIRVELRFVDGNPDCRSLHVSASFKKKWEA